MHGAGRRTYPHPASRLLTWRRRILGLSRRDLAPVRRCPVETGEPWGPLGHSECSSRRFCCGAGAWSRVRTNMQTALRLLRGRRSRAFRSWARPASVTAREYRDRWTRCSASRAVADRRRDCRRIRASGTVGSTASSTAPSSRPSKCGPWANHTAIGSARPSRTGRGGPLVRMSRLGS